MRNFKQLFACFLTVITLYACQQDTYLIEKEEEGVTNPEKTDAYSWWTHWANARARNVGWRIDYWLASQAIASKIKNPAIHPDILGSDHCPVSIEL